MSSNRRNIAIQHFSDLGNDLDLKLILALTLVCAAFFFIPYLNDTILRTAFGLVFLLFIPGYTFIAALFPGKSGIDLSERVAFSLAVNLALVGLVGMGLNLSPWGVRLMPVVLILMCLTFTFIGVSWIRRLQLEPNERFNGNLANVLHAQQALLPETGVHFNRVLMVVFYIAIAVSAVMIGYIVAEPPQRETYTEFYILGPSGMATDYPTNYTLGEQKALIVGVENHESHSQQYVVEARLNGSSRATTLYSNKITLENNESWKQSIMVRPDQVGTHMKLEFLLYEDNNSTAPYEETHLWVNVTR